MSQAFTRILDNQSNKLLANIASVDLTNSIPVQPMPSQVQVMPSQVQVMPSQVQVMPSLADEVIPECKLIKLFGYEFTVYTLIFIIILLVCVGYFLYKYFFTQTDVVIYKKNFKKDLKKNKLKNKEEFSNSSDISNMLDSSDNSSSAQTLDK